MDGISSPTVIGRFILRNAPASDAWLFEQYTLEEIGEHNSIDSAEEALIKLYRPCLNTVANPDPTPLPLFYKVRSADNPYGQKIVTRFGVKCKGK